MRRWAAPLARRLLSFVPGGTIVRVVRGPLRGARWTMHSAPHGCWAGTYESDTQQLFTSHVKPSDVVYDVGANVGFFTLLASRLAPRGHVYAFEPFPRNIEILERHVALNDLQNVTILPIAAARTSGSSRFQPGDSASQGRLSGSGSIEVSTASIDELVESGRIRPPDVMKIDVEGAESEVLAGAAQTIAASRPTFILSTHGCAQHELCWSFLMSAGYRPELARDGAIDGYYTILAKRY